MDKAVKVNERKLKTWTQTQLRDFFAVFSDSKQAEVSTANYILKAWNGNKCSWEKLPKLVSNSVKYTIGAFKEQNRFIITIMNPKTGAFGKATIAEKDYNNFSWTYGVALAWARLKGETVYILDDSETTMDKVSAGQHFIWKDCEWVMTFTSYDYKYKYYHYVLYNITERFVRDMTSNHIKQDKVKLID